MKITTQNGEHSCKRTELSLKRKEVIVSHSHEHFTLCVYVAGDHRCVCTVVAV